jgi:SPP1 family predicted phage head-tail adaptor
MKLQAGMLDRRLVIKARAPGEDEGGQPNGEWSVVVCRPWANYRAPSGIGSINAERIEAGREVSSSMCSWRIRYRTDITAGMRAEETANGVTTIWDIKQVLPDRRFRQHVDLVCETGVSNG